VLGFAQPADADGSYIVAWAEGESRRVKPSQFNVAALVSGSLHHAVAADAAGVSSQLQSHPVDVVTHLLRDVRTSMTKPEIERKLEDLFLRLDPDWWPPVAKGLKAHPHVVAEGPRYAWSDSVVDKPATSTGPKRAKTTGAPRTRRGFGDVVVSHRDDKIRDDHSSVAPDRLSDEVAVAVATDDHGARGATPGPGRTDSPSGRDASRIFRQALESMLAGRSVDSAAVAAMKQVAAAEDASLSRFAAALHAASMPDGDLDVAGVDLMLLSAPLRYDLGRLALRRRAYGAFTRSLAAAEPPDAARLLAQAPMEDEDLLHALVDAASALPRLDARLAERWERVLRRVVEAVAEKSTLVPVGLSLLAALSALPGHREHKPLTFAGQQLLDACLRSRSAVAAISDAPREALLALATSDFARPVIDERERWFKLMIALDDADRPDVLEAAAVWLPLNVSILTERPRLTSLLETRGLTERVAQPLLEAALDPPAPDVVLRLLTLPDPLVRTLAQAQLAAQLGALVDDATGAGEVFSTLLERLRQGPEASAADRIAAELRHRSSEIETLSGTLSDEREAHERTRRQLDAFRQGERAADDTATAQSRHQALQVAIDIVEELRLASLARPEDHAVREVSQRIAPVLAAEGLQAIGNEDQVITYDPSHFRLLGSETALEPGAPAVVVRPAYILSQGQGTVLRYGEVRPQRTSTGGS